MQFSSHFQHENSGKGRWRKVTAVVLMVCCAGFGAAAAREAILAHRERVLFEELAEKVQEKTPVSELLTPESQEIPPSSEPESSETPSEPQILRQYAPLFEENPEFFGWIQIEHSAVDYPVMHTPDDPEKYLRRNFYGDPSEAGTVFLDYRCSADTDNRILYGHNMNDGTMFQNILYYANEDYWRAHPVIHFDTLYEPREYEVMAAFYDRVYWSNETCFKFYNFIEAEDSAAFDEAVRNYQEKSLYDTGVTAEYGEHLLTLCTCSYHTENGRFVVVARERKPE